MTKAVIVAREEFLLAVRTKTFLFSVLLLPLVVGAGFALQVVVQGLTGEEEKRVAIVDLTGELYDAVGEAAARRKAGGGAGGGGVRSVPERIEVRGRPLRDIRLELSERVRSGALAAFVEIPREILDPVRGTTLKIRWHALEGGASWWDSRLRVVLDEEIRARRLERAGIDAEERARLKRLFEPVGFERFGLASRGAKGDGIGEPERVDEFRALGIPVVFAMLLFFVLMTSAPLLTNSVLEEKMGRISEVLLGAVTPFELMLGKLAGAAGVALTLAALYVAGGLLLAWRWNYLDALSLSAFLWFAVYLVAGVFFYGSLFIAVGAAASGLKDAQSLMTPVVLCVMVPMFVWHVVLEAPSSAAAVVMTLIPPATPILMPLRLSLEPAPSPWHVALSLVVCLLSTLAVAWAAGRIFRIGLLFQGKTPSLRELWRWLRA